MQMQQVRVGRGHQVPVPPASAAPLEISREMRQQLRATRHGAFERHQENARLTKELLDGQKAADDSAIASCGRWASPVALRKQIEASKQRTEELERKLAKQEERQKEAQSRFVEMLTLLKAVGDDGALKEAQEKLEAEKEALRTTKPRKIEIVRL